MNNQKNSNINVHNA